MVAYTKPQQRKKEEIERLRGERDQIKFIDHRFEKYNNSAIAIRTSYYIFCCRNKSWTIPDLLPY